MAYLIQVDLKLIYDSISWLVGFNKHPNRDKDNDYL